MENGFGKNALLIAVAVIVLIIAIKFVFFGKSKDEMDAAVRDRDAAKAKDNKIEEMTKEGVRRNYTDDEYITFADQIYEAVSGIGTDEDTVFRIIYKIRTPLDYELLDKAFGRRKEQTLATWIQGEFSTADIAKLNKSLVQVGAGKKF